MIKKLLSLAIIFIMLPLGMVYAQNSSIHGEVVEAATGEPLPGANVYVTQLERGASTNIDGEFQIRNVPLGVYNIRITFVGYRAVERTVEVGPEPATLNVEMQVGAAGLGELIVSGYAVTTKRELTGSIASVRSQDIQDVTLQNAESLLQGRAAGVNVTAASGNPGGAFRVSVRGNGSITAASEPLYIIDGVQVSFSQLSGLSSTSPLNQLNPADIESIEVLKDASSAAIYGAQAAAGVVIITTKRGQEGRTRITARAETGSRHIARVPGYVNADQYLEYLGEALVHNGIVGTVEDGRAEYTNAFIDEFGEAPEDWSHIISGDSRLADTDWVDFIYAPGVTQKYYVSAAGGDETTRFRLSGGYEDTDGTAYNSEFTRLNLRTNLDHQVSDRFLTRLNLNLARSTQFGICEDGNFVNCAPAQAMLESPFAFPFHADGSYAATNFGLTNNPAVIRDEVDRNVTVMTILGDVNLRYRANDWLSFTGFVGFDYRDTEDERFDSPVAIPAQGGRLNMVSRRVNNFNSNLRANLSQTFQDVHNFNGMFGVEYRRDQWRTLQAIGDGFPGQFFRVMDASADMFLMGGRNEEFRVGSYFGNVQYNFNDRYFLSVVARYDGHSRFGADTRWGFFPSISGAWRISQENFFNVDVIDELKFRAGFGTTGNSNIGNYGARGLYSALGSYMGTTALTPTQLANVNLGWEEAREINLGLDFEILAGRITGAVDVYRKDNEGLLLQRLLPVDSGFSAINENIGSVRNEGVEFELGTVNVSTRDFMWRSRFNVAFLDNEILELPDNESIRPDDALESLQIGQPIGLIQVPRWAGVNPADGRPMWYDADGNITYNPVQDRDAVRYKDGVANTVGGFGNTLSFRGFTLDAFFNFSFGQWGLASTDFYFTRTPDFWSNMSTEVLDRWKEPGDMTYYPRAIQAGGDYPETANYRTTLSTQSIHNASYIRLKNVSLSYNLPSSIVNQLNLGNVRLFASGLNLLTFTGWQWYDPEIAWDTTDIYNNLTTASYPTEKQFNAGIEIEF